MSRRVVGGFLGAVAVLLVSACHPAVGPAARPDPQAAVEGALTWLEGQAAAGYHLPSGATFTAARGGLARGTLTLAGQPAQALRAGGNLYLRAPAAYWTAQGMSPERANEYGARWARSVLPLDPGRDLAPDVLARALRSAIPDGARAELLTLGDGTELFDVQGLQVTATAPYRVTSFKPSLLGPAGPPVLGTTAVEVNPVGPAGQADLRTGLGDDLDGLGQPFVAGPVVATRVTENTLRCTAVPTCTDSVQVGTEPIGDAPQALARLVLKSSVSGELGTRDCGQELVAPLGAPVSLSCVVKFDLPKVAGRSEVSAVPTVTAEPVAVVDVPGIRQEIGAAPGA
ncbi:MAG TPA: hypothetical protein VJ870_01720 [Amycolatopsis sp.]|nr:hypothetical protein [Amycolatopsis sp.]